VDGEMKDISFGGAFIHCPQPFKIHEVLRIVIKVSDLDRPLEATAKVIRSSGYDPREEGNPRGVGIKFMDTINS
jgi:Tfp pilus assembly protein PilZ